MDIGVVFPQTEIGTDPELLREYARRAESLGFDHLLAYDHVLGVDPERPGWEGSYDYEDQFHEPLTLFSHLGAVTTDLSFVTGVLVLPQRGTPLVAKQAAQVDLFSDGQFRLGIGVGWNEPEYEGMGGLLDPRQARRGADNCPSPALDRRTRRVRGRVSLYPPGRHRSAARPAPDTGVDRGRGRARTRANRPHGRRLAPTVATPPRSRRATGDDRSTRRKCGPGPGIGRRPRAGDRRADRRRLAVGGRRLGGP